MKADDRKTGYLPALVLSAAALFLGGRLKRALIRYLGGSYGIMTEFYSDWAYNTFYTFSRFRNAALLLTVLAILLLAVVYKRSGNSKKSLYLSLLVFAVGCIAYAVILNPPAKILHFIFSRVCCFALYIIAAHTVIAKQ